KQAYARERLAEAGLAQHVEFRLGDALELLRQQPGPAGLVLLDVWKDLYGPCFELVYALLSPGGVIVPDDMLPQPGTRPQAHADRAAVRAKPDLEAALLPIGHGVDVAVRKVE